MSTYLVYLVDPFETVPLNWKTTINVKMQEWFSKCVGASKKFDKALVHWPAYEPKPDPSQLMLYYVPNTDKSIIKVEFGETPPHNNRGLTRWRDSKGAVSEVYMSAMAQNIHLAAAQGFHELMHNKLRMDDATLHPRGGLAADPLPNNAQINQRNINDMGGALNNPAPQLSSAFMKAFVGKRDQLSPYYTI